MKLTLGVLSGIALAGCLASAVLAFTGVFDEGTYKAVFLVCSVLWFAISAWRIYLPEKP